MALEAGIEDAPHARVPLQPARHLERGLVLPLHPQRQRLQAADEEEGALRIEDASEDAPQVLDRLHQSRAPADRAGHEVVMAAEVFGAGLDDQIDAFRQRALVHRRRERPVDDQVRARAGVARAGERREVRDAQIGVRRRFGEDHLGASRAQRRAEGLLVARLDQGGLDAEAREEAGDELPCPPVAVVGEDDVVGGLEQLEERGGRGCHSAGEQGRVLGALQRRKLLLRRAHGRIPVTAVLLALDVAVEVALDLGGVGERVRRGPDDGGGDGVVRLLARFSAMDGERPLLRIGYAIVGHGGQPSRPPRWLKEKPSRLE